MQEVVKFAGDCLIIIFQADEEEEDNEDSFAYWTRAKDCARALLDVIKQVSDDLDLHGGLDRGNIQRIHLKDLRAGSPRTRTARQRLQELEESTMTSAELETRRSRWFCVAGRPLKLAGAMLDKSAAGRFILLLREQKTIPPVPPIYKINNTWYTTIYCDLVANVCCSLVLSYFCFLLSFSLLSLSIL